jgi:outer membrane protein assembly factor BamA
MRLPILNINFFSFLTFFGLSCFIVSSCTIVKHYTPNKPFIFKNTIKFKGSNNLDKAKTSFLQNALLQQIEDSVAVKPINELPWPKFPFIIPVSVIKKPTSFSEEMVIQSQNNMLNLLHSNGFLSSSIYFDSSISTYKDQQRIKVNYNILLGKLYLIDTIGYELPDSNLQKIAIESQNEAFVKKGEPFYYSTIDQELNRLVTIFKNKGYYTISRDEFYVEADSSYTELLDPSIDAFEYLRRLAVIKQQKKENPSIAVYIRMYSPKDGIEKLPYKVGNFSIYPDLSNEISTQIEDTVKTELDGFVLYSLKNTFDAKFITNNVALKPGAFFNQLKFSQTLNNFNRLGAWQNINIIPKQNDSLHTIDYTLQLTSAKKQFFSIDLEGSSVLNTSQLILIGSGKAGFAINFRLKNRNIAKKAIQLDNTVRSGLEFNDFKKILSNEITFSNRFTIPWLLKPLKSSLLKDIQGAKSIASLDFAYINRFQYYILRSANIFIGYEWKPNLNTTWQYKPINIELTRINQDVLFKEALQKNPLLVYAYNNGLIIGTNAGYTKTFAQPNAKHLDLIRVYGEESGLVLGTLFKNQTSQGKVLADLFKFVRFDLDYRHYINYTKTSLAFRFFAGYGNALQTNSRKGDITLPFFRSYFAGGPNSMRGWQIRKLGVGSNIFLDTLSNGVFNDKYADMRLETNVEYRFNLFQFFGFWMKGALFTDVGNIWYRHDLNGDLPGAQFSFKNLYKDLAISPGYGIRMDFSFFLLRFDLGYPFKDPRYGPDKSIGSGFYSTNKNGWLVNGVWNKPVFQFAIGYPF